jgi:hypothetical protein
MITSIGTRLARSRFYFGKPITEVLAARGVRPPGSWFRTTLWADPVAVDVGVADQALGNVVFDELVPPWDLRVDRASPPHTRFFAFSAAAATAPLAGERRAEVSYGDRRVAVAERGTVRTGVFSDSESFLVWHQPTRCAVMVVPASMPALDVRDVLHRQLVQTALQERGSHLMHGSGLAVQGSGVLLTGPSGAGKTSLQLDLARALGADLLGGGRIYLDQVGTMRPYPGRFVIGVGLLANRPQLGLAPADRPDRRGKITVPSQQLAAALGVGIAVSAPLRLILLPRLDGSADRLVAGKRLAERDAWAALAGQCMSPDTRWPNWLKAFPDTDRESALAAVRDAVAGVPVRPVLVPVSATPPSPSEAAALIAESLP